jgi:hypothetical protein
MSEQDEQKVVELVDAGVPADQGLSSLGLIMQLAGNVFAAAAAVIAVPSILKGTDGLTLWILILLGLSIARSLFHRAAGAQLLYGENNTGRGNRMAGIRRYIGFGLLHSFAFGALLIGKFEVPGKIALGIVGGLAAWPVTLAVILALPRFKRFRDDLPLTEDKGFEGTSILMTVLGLCGVAFTGTILTALLGLPSKELQRGPGVLVVLALGMLVVRSVLHVQAGLSGLRETSVDRSVELANRYSNFGVISSFCAAGAMLLFVMASAMNVIGLALICGLCWLLMAWPLIVRKFYSDRQFADLLAGEHAPLHRRAPDAGLTSLGWLLLAHAAFTASCLIPELLSGGGSSSQMFALGGALGVRSLWWNVGLVVLQGWAGYELIRMSPQSRVVATVFGVVGVAVTLYVSWPLIAVLRHSHGLTEGPQEAMMIGPLALSLIIPVATILLVNRVISPTARARFRPRPTGSETT